MGRCSVGLDGGADEVPAQNVVACKSVDAAKARRVLLGDGELPGGLQGTADKDCIC